MRTPSSLVVLGLLGLAAGCSRGKPTDSKHLDLVLDEYTRRRPVVSAIELAGEAKVTPAAVAASGVTAPLHAHRRAPKRAPAMVARRAPKAEHTPVVAHLPQPSVAAAPAPVAAADPAPIPAAEPTNPEPDPQPRHGGGGWSAPTDGGIHFPGLPGGGVIIIRGGHGGNDPCDEHGRGGIGGILGGLPSPVGRGFPGGIRFLRAR